MNSNQLESINLEVPPYTPPQISAVPYIRIVQDKEYRKTKSLKNYLFLKRTLDILFSLLTIILLSPLFIIIAIIIFIDDPKGSPFFIQKRCGKDGRLFNFYKFRSMHMGAEEMLSLLLAQNEMDGPVFKIREDPRITCFGKFIRKTSIDELPQFLNVLMGNMSIVGPRPALPREVEHYDEMQRKRLFIKPGLTCYWQITPNRNSLSFNEWVELDLKYINDQCLSLDIKLVIKTVKAVINGEGV